MPHSVEEIQGLITSFKLSADNSSCLQVSPRYHFYLIMAIHPLFLPCPQVLEPRWNISVYCQTGAYHQ